ncbi:uncharacterized protein [Nicotiana sylvestris]|uniref:uncharacterized protein n=1 Tax=Nicotiana sylvestris TaxID=4096 RepID=UPI00388C81A1
MEENTEVPLNLGRPFLVIGRAIIDVHQGQLILRVDEERVIFYMQKMIKFPGNESSSSCFQIDLLDDLVDEFKDNQLITDSLERFLVRSRTTSDENPTIREEAKTLEKESENEKVSQEEIQSKIELKNLPSHLKNVFLEPELFPVIISYSLTPEQEYKLIEVLRKHKRALGWTLADIKGINPAICIHRILMEENYKPIVQPQRRLNPTMQEVVKKEVVKLLAAGIIYPISDSPWISIAPEDQEKTTFACPQEGIVLEHKITAKGIEVDKAKIDLIAGLPPPTTVKDDCTKAFEFLKEQLTNAPIVVSPDWSQPFEIMCDANDIIRRCVPETETNNIISHCHDGAVGGHYGGRKTATKVLEVGFYWPNLFKDTRNYAATCDKCQRSDAGKNRLLQLDELEEFRLTAYKNAKLYKEKTKKWHDKLIRHKYFKVGDHVLLYNSRLRLFPGKFKSRWTGPYIVTGVTPYGAIEVQHADGGDKFKVNGHRLKPYISRFFDKQASTILFA